MSGRPLKHVVGCAGFVAAVPGGRTGNYWYWTSRARDDEVTGV